MKLLAVDTATSSCSVALLDGQHLLAEIVYTGGKTHSGHLMTMIHQLLERCGCGPGDIQGVGVTIGPGTFTGLRIGISLVKGLCMATHAPVIGVSSLAALAFPLAAVERPVVSIIDARRHEVYWAQFQAGEKEPEMKTPVSVDDPRKVADSLPNRALIVGSGALLYRSTFESRHPDIRLADPAQHVIRGSSVGMLALNRFAHQNTAPIDTLTPEYIRKSDAQIHVSGTC